MVAKASTAFHIDVLVVASMAATVLPAGCQSSNAVVATQTSKVCPLCERETRVQPLTGLKYTTCVCPTCKEVSTLDPDLVRSLERFTGGPVGDGVAVCNSCGVIVTDCAVCREKRAS